MIAAIGAGREDRVLDVATGTGLVARGLVERYGCAVVGLDQSRDMLAGARRALAGAPQLAARIDLVQGEAERLPFDDGEFDHLTFTYLLRYVDDPAATLAELARVVKAGGRIARLEVGLPDPPPWPPPGGPGGGGKSPVGSPASPTRRYGGRCGASTPGSFSQPRGGGSGRSGTRSVASWVRASKSSTPAGRSSASSSCGARPGSRRFGCAG